MTPPIEIEVQYEDEARDLPLPRYQSQYAAGFDLHAAVEDSLVIQPQTFQHISTGIRLAIPQGYEGQVRPRSGLAFKHGIGVLNAPGTIDADYRGVIGVILFNFSAEPFFVYRGDRIAQLVISKVERAQFRQVDVLSSSQRQDGGFGSTGR